MKKIFNIIFISLTFFLFSCENTNDKKVFGQIVGAAVGGYLGSKVGSGITKDIAVILGGATGYILGGRVIEILNESEKNEFNDVIEDSLNYEPDNSIKSWESSQDNETYGEVTPLNNYSIKEKECRDFKKIIRKAGEIYEEVSTACRNEQGDWILI